MTDIYCAVCFVQGECDVCKEVVDMLRALLSKNGTEVRPV